jgi:hypothetical protein
MKFDKKCYQLSAKIKSSLLFRPDEKNNQILKFRLLHLHSIQNVKIKIIYLSLHMDVNLILCDDWGRTCLEGSIWPQRREATRRCEKFITSSCIICTLIITVIRTNKWLEGHVEYTGEPRNMYKLLDWKHEGKGQLGIPSRRSDYNIKISFK